MPGEKMDDEFANYGLDREPQKTDPVPSPVVKELKAKNIVGQATDYWGPADPHNDAYTEAVANGWINSERVLTAEGVAKIEENKKKGDIRIGKPKPEVKATKYSLGMVTRQWGIPGEFNDAGNEALEKKWVDSVGRITEAGLAELERAGQEAASARAVEAQESPEEKRGVRPALFDRANMSFPTSAAAREGVRKTEISKNLKDLEDSVRRIIDDRGFVVKDIVITEQPKRKLGAETEYELVISFYRTNRGGDNKKSTHETELAGTSRELLDQLALDDLGIPSTDKQRKPKRKK